MERFLLNLKKCCEIVYSTFHMDVVVADPGYQVIESFCHNPTPYSMTHAYWPDYYETVAKQLDVSSGVSSFWHELPEAYMICLDIAVDAPNGARYYICVGPALTRMYNDSFFYSLKGWEKLPPKDKPAILTMYKHLPFFNTRVKNEFWMSYQLFKNVNQVESSVLDIPIVKSTSSVMDVPNNISEPPISAEQIHLNYDGEKKWRAFVSAGDRDRAKQAISNAASTDFSYRMPDNPIRCQKNVYLSMNTILRVAAFDGGAFPVDVHNTHEYFAVAIENAKNMMDIERVAQSIIDKYCDIVIAARTKKCSPPVKKAVTYIHNHYAQPLSLKQLASELHYSEAHISRVFQQEMGETVGSYTNKLRVENAARLLGSGTYSITDIAIQVGFSSYSKFSVEFKKQFGMTATDYVNRNNILK